MATSKQIIFDSANDVDDEFYLSDANFQLAELIGSWERRHNTELGGILIAGTRHSRYGLPWDVGRGGFLLINPSREYLIEAIADKFSNGNVQLYIENNKVYVKATDHDGYSIGTITLVSQRVMENKNIEEFVNNYGMSQRVEKRITGKNEAAGTKFAQAAITQYA